MNNKEFKEGLKKYNIKCDETDYLYSKSFFITNTDSPRLEGDMNYKVIENINSNVHNIDAIEISFNYIDSCKNSRFILRSRDHLELGEVIFTIDDWDNDKSDIWNETNHYNKVSMDIARLFKNKGHENVKVYYTMHFIKDECIFYIRGCERLKDEFEALKFIDDCSQFFTNPNDFIESDTLLLYSPYGLKVISENLNTFNDILLKHDIEFKGLFYSKCEFETIESLDPPGYDVVLYGDYIPEKALLIDVSTTPDENNKFSYKIVNAALEVHDVLGIKPRIFNGSTILSNNTHDIIKDNEYVFIKDIHKGLLLITDMEKYPDRYIGNFMHSVSVFTYCCDFYSDLCEIYTYRLNDDVFNVYVERYDKNTSERSLTRYTVDTSIFNIEEINLMISSTDLLSPDFDPKDMSAYKEFNEFTSSSESSDELKSAMAGYIVLHNLLNVDITHDEDLGFDEDEMYISECEKSIQNKIRENIHPKVILNGLLNEKEKEIFSGPYHKRYFYTRQQIISEETLKHGYVIQLGELSCIDKSANKVNESEEITYKSLFESVANNTEINNIISNRLKREKELLEFIKHADESVFDVNVLDENEKLKKEIPLGDYNVNLTSIYENGINEFKSDYLERMECFAKELELSTHMKLSMAATNDEYKQLDTNGHSINDYKEAEKELFLTRKKITELKLPHLEHYILGISTETIDIDFWYYDPSDSGDNPLESIDCDNGGGIIGMDIRFLDNLYSFYHSETVISNLYNKDNLNKLTYNYLANYGLKELNKLLNK